MPARKTFAQLQAEHRRLAILRFLDAAPGMSLNGSVVHSALESAFFICTQDQVASDLTWLGEQLLVDVEFVGDVPVATITRRGQDVAAGRAQQPGVARELPNG
jgi:hypothetical protein